METFVQERFAMVVNVRGYEAKALLVKTSQTSWSQNFVLQIYIYARQNEVLAGLNKTLRPSKRSGRLCFIRHC